jgi:hypothetical protein
MPRRPSPEKEAEYAELCAFVEMWATVVWKVDPESPAHPANVGPRILAEVGLSKALEGERQGINDVLEGLRDWKPERIRELDIALRNDGYITITELRRRYASRYKSILKRGLLRNETDYYLVKDILGDVESPIAAEEREHLGQMVLAFESKRSP